ncbi:hypothetical protein LINPERHAP1_LOCUS19283 [Linum perenne]
MVPVLLLLFFNCDLVLKNVPIYYTLRYKGPYYISLEYIWFLGCTQIRKEMNKVVGKRNVDQRRSAEM